MLFFLRKWNLIRCNMVNTPQVCVLQPEQTVSRLLIRKSRPAAKKWLWATCPQTLENKLQEQHTHGFQCTLSVNRTDSFHGCEAGKESRFCMLQSTCLLTFGKLQTLLALLLFKDTLHSSSVTDMVCVHASQHLLRKWMFTTDLPLKCWIELR